MASIGRAIRSLERHESVHQIVCTVVDGRIEWKYLGVHIPDVEEMPDEVIEERIALLRELLTTRELGQWVVQAITTETAMLRAALVQRVNRQMSIDDILPPIDGVSPAPIAVGRSASDGFTR